MARICDLTRTHRCFSGSCLLLRTVTSAKKPRHRERLLREAPTCAGFTVDEPEDMFWGDRMAQTVDPFGHHWTVRPLLHDAGYA